MARMILVPGSIPRRLKAGEMIQNPEANPPEFLMACPKCGANGLIQDHEEVVIEVHDVVAGVRPLRNISITPHVECPICKVTFKSVQGVVEFLDGDDNGKK